jgi:hypothetical protein
VAAWVVRHADWWWVYARRTSCLVFRVLTLGSWGKIYQTRHPVGLHSVACDSQQCT